MIILVGVAVVGLTWFVLGSGDGGDRGSAASSSIIEQTTVPSSTIAEIATSPPATPPAFAPPPVPDEAVWVFSGPGVAYTVADPLPSGLAMAEVQPALSVAQRAADMLAANDWTAAQSVLTILQPDGTVVVPNAQYLRDRWGSADRLSLVLLDAQRDPSGAGFNLVVGTIANLADGSTKVSCNHLYSDPDIPAVQDLGNASVISQGEGAFVPEAFLNDATRVEDLEARCV